MGTRSSKYTNWPKHRPDPRILTGEALTAMSALVIIHGDTAKGHPSTRRERRAAKKRVKLHMIVKMGVPFDYHRQYRPPKFPNRTPGGETRINIDGRKFG